MPGTITLTVRRRIEHLELLTAPDEVAGETMILAERRHVSGRDRVELTESELNRRAFDRGRPVWEQGEHLKSVTAAGGRQVKTMRQAEVEQCRAC